MKIKTLFIGLLTLIVGILFGTSTMMKVQVNADGSNTQESFSIAYLEGFDSTKDNEIYDYVGAKLKYVKSYKKFYLLNADNPSAVKTLVAPEYIMGCEVKYDEFDITKYTGLETLVAFAGYQLRPSLANMHFKDLYLQNPGVLGAKDFTVDNLYFTIPYYYTGTSYSVSSLKSLNASHYYYYDWNELCLNQYLDLCSEAGVNFELKRENECRFTKESFYPFLNYSITMKSFGITYVNRKKTGQLTESEYDFYWHPTYIDSRLKTLYLDLDTTYSIDNNKEYYAVISKSRISYLYSLKTNILVIPEANEFEARLTAQSIYITESPSNPITTINGDGNDIGKIYLPCHDDERFSQILTKFGDKVEYYDTLPQIDFKFTDDEGINTYKTRNYDIDIDYCLNNINILKNKGITVNENTYLDDVFSNNNMRLKENTPHKVTFNTGNVVYIPPVVTTTLSSIEDPNAPGYSFEGWFMDENYTTPIDIEAFVEADMTIYGKFTKKEYLLSFDAGGVVSNPKSVVTGYINDLPQLNYKAGTFKGWYYDSKFTSIVKPQEALTKDTTLYAKWDLQKFVITFNVNGKIDDFKIYAPCIMEFPNTEVKNQTFEGWYYDENFENEAHLNDYVIEDTVLYGKFVKKESLFDKTTEEIKEWTSNIKDKIENNKALKVSMIVVGSVTGILLIYGAYLLIRKIIKWLRRR